MSSSSWSVKAVLSAGIVLLGLATIAQASTYSAVIVYGDSLSDNGNLFAASGGTEPPSPPYFDGRMSNGPVTVEQLATLLAVPLVDYAWIGATTGIGNYGDGGTPTSFGADSLPGMQTTFAATEGSLGPYLGSGLFVVWGGPDDLLSPSPLDTTVPEIVNRAVNDELGIVDSLVLMGAKHILVPGMPDLGVTPYFQSLPGGALEGAEIAAAFNAELSAELPPGVIFYDTAGLVDSMVADPSAFGFTDVTDPCFNGTSVCSNPGQYLFYDSFHPTTAADAFAAKGFYAAVTPEPSAFLPLILGGGALWLARRRRVRRIVGKAD